MSIKLIVTRGFGNGAFSTTIKDVVTRGFDVGIQIDVVGYLSGEISVFSATNGSARVINSLIGDIVVNNTDSTQ